MKHIVYIHFVEKKKVSDCYLTREYENIVTFFRIIFYKIQNKSIIKLFASSIFFSDSL